MHRISRFILVEAPIERVFEFTSDYRNLPRIQTEFQTVLPLSAQTRGLGAQVEATGSFRGLPIRVKLEVVKFEPPHLLVSDSAGAIRSRTTWTFREQSGGPDAPARTRAAVAVEYEIQVPGLSLLGGLVQRDVDEMTTCSLRRLKSLLEGGER
ncbi:MAG: SRPBCC family protein [Chloroflexia bacterium]